MDIFEKIRSNRGALGQYSEVGDGYFMFPKLEGEIAPRMMFRGKKVLTWSLNNYLGLANNPEVRKADAEYAGQYGLGYPMGARMMSGHTSNHEKFEKMAAEFVGKESAYLLNYGYQGMVSMIDALVDRHDVIVYDSESHACIMDGLRLHFGKRFVYAHNDIESCEKQLQRATKLTEESGGGILVITEGVFGMAGDLGKLDKIAELKKKYNFRFLVDDAHGFGTMGPTGAGTGEHFGVQDKIDIYFATFAKSMAGIGGFLAGDKDIVTYLRFNLRSQIYAKALPMAMTLGAIKRLELIKAHPEYREKLWIIVNALQKGLREAGLDLGRTESPVTPVFMKVSLEQTTQLIYDLRENFNIFCSVVIYPVVPKDVVMLRLIPTAQHTLEDVEFTVNAFRELKRKVDNNVYPKVMADFSK
ncbi:MAG TPA: aminotransferase class I/II-fold pyridoxal phosphate-dependent enzyme [Bacteroidales bacterium]|nr:aminotransferase class I/II-fold pyridoxal phosphate-dependent enzyme [Bacteroidales bacterium]HOX73694.1 aminotransferase class I/II-fold pyridoxal phosphate-dependent enzyme [Bacteroidales bacterium]HPM86918.1 aminotransferase class I/II-fold pyridoxal phosphate-dependent enzyme [Bacteroidales bacterium]HQM69857.1 aminotransferase class I/II-fold pyridoxal phosphate-dependent enzyme [Bacteroidales bacterium]